MFIFSFNLIIILLLITGFIFVGSANNFEYKTFKHLISIVIGLVLFVITSTSMIAIKHLIFNSWILWITSFLVVISTLFIGTTVNGAKSWIYIGNFSFQPSELIKFSLPFVFAYLAYVIKNKLVFFVLSMSIFGISTIPIFLQPDLGFSLLLFFTTLIVNYCYGINGFIILLTMGLFIIAGSFVIKPYQLERLITFLDPYKDPLGNGWQTIQSVNCHINGGLWGQGIGKGIVSKLGFLPEKDTDFIFSLISEEIGLIGSLLIICLFLLLIFHLLIIHYKSVQIEHKIISGYVFGIIFIQSFINIAMNTMSGPITGLPLPLISYGGTNMVVTLFLLGTMNQIYFQIVQKQKIDKWIK
ncbi:MAG: FtsW/RodA/SpoVE family cell cycle protein [bacterium]